MRFSPTKSFLALQLSMTLQIKGYTRDEFFGGHGVIQAGPCYLDQPLLVLLFRWGGSICEQVVSWNLTT